MFVEDLRKENRKDAKVLYNFVFCLLILICLAHTFTHTKYNLLSYLGLFINLL